MKISRLVLFPALAALLCIASAASGQSQSAQQNFLGKWKLDTALCKIAHPNETGNVQWRAYEPDGDRVKVSWGNAAGLAGTYSAKCDGTLEPTSAGQIRCRQAGANKINGEQIDAADPLHRFYSRIISSRGKVMSIIWYADEKRHRALDRFVYTKN
jgi:hypothetical protein